MSPAPAAAAWEPPSGESGEPPASTESVETSTESVEADPIETLYLRDGSFVRGVVIERVDGSHVVIEVVGSSEHREIPWSELKMSEPAEDPRDDDDATSDDGPFVHVEVTGRRLDRYHVTLEAITGVVAKIEYDFNKGGFRPRTSYVTRSICRAPCDQSVSLDESDGFIITTLKRDASSNRKAIPSRRFEIPAQGPVHLRVRPGRRDFIIVGSVLGVAGILSIIGAAALSVRSHPGGATVVGVGAAGGIVAGVTLLFMSPTRVKVKQ